MLALLAQTLPTTAPTLTTAAPTDWPLAYAVPIAVGVIAATGPLLNAAITWWYQARATRFQTYLTAYKAAKESDLATDADREWGKRVLAQLTADLDKRPFDEITGAAGAFGITLIVMGVGGSLASGVYGLPPIADSVFSLMRQIGGLLIFLTGFFGFQRFALLLTIRLIKRIRLWQLQRKRARLVKKIRAGRAQLASENERKKELQSRLVLGERELERLLAERERLTSEGQDLRSQTARLAEERIGMERELAEKNEILRGLQAERARLEAIWAAAQEKKESEPDSGREGQ